MADPKYKDDDYQRRAIVGNRHFVSAGGPNTWLLPGVKETGKVDKHGRRIFTKHKIVTTQQLMDWAKSNGQSVYITDKYHVHHPAKYEPRLLFS